MTRDSINGIVVFSVKWRCQDHEKYRKAVRMISSDSENKVWLWVRVLIYISGIIFCYVLFTTVLQIILAINGRIDLAQNETRVHFGMYINFS